MKIRAPDFTAKELKRILKYNPNTGIFTRLRSGRIAGGTDTDTKYWRIMISGRLYHAHRLAWYYMTGEWPPSTIDH